MIVSLRTHQIFTEPTDRRFLNPTHLESPARNKRAATATTHRNGGQVKKGTRPCTTFHRILVQRQEGHSLNLANAQYRISNGTEKEVLAGKLPRFANHRATEHDHESVPPSPHPQPASITLILVLSHVGGYA
jgi:hypothetical protein